MPVSTVPRPARHRRLLLWFLLLAGVLAAGHALVWHHVTGRLEAGFQDWAEGRRAQGWQVTHGTPRAGGWPFLATLILPDLALTPPSGFGWRTERAELSLRPTDRGLLHIAAEGRHVLYRAGWDWPFTAESLTADLPLAGSGPPAVVTLRGAGLRLGGAPGAEQGMGLDALEARIDGQDTSPGGPGLVLTAALRGLSLPGAIGGLLPGGRVDTATLDAALNGPLPGGLFSAAPPARRAAAWRDAGGTLELRALTLRAGAVAASAAATLALDGGLQPVGAGTLRLFNPDLVLEALLRAGVIDPRNGGLARSLLPMLQRPGAAGGPPQLEVPVTLEQGRLTAARIPLLRLPPLAWD